MQWKLGIRFEDPVVERCSDVQQASAFSEQEEQVEPRGNTKAETSAQIDEEHAEALDSHSELPIAMSTSPVLQPNSASVAAEESLSSPGLPVTDLDSVARESERPNPVLVAAVTEDRNAEVGPEMESEDQPDELSTTTADEEVHTQPLLQDQLLGGQDAPGNDEHAKGANGGLGFAGKATSVGTTTATSPSVPAPITTTTEETGSTHPNNPAEHGALPFHDGSNSVPTPPATQTNILSLDAADDDSFSLVEVVFNSLPLGLRLQHTDVPALVLPESGHSLALRVDSVRVAKLCERVLDLLFTIPHRTSHQLIVSFRSIDSNLT